MPVDVKIGSVETNLTATSPDLLRSPQFMAEIVRMVKQELQRDQAVSAQRDADRNIGTQPPGRRF